MPFHVDQANRTPGVQTRTWVNGIVVNFAPQTGDLFNPMSNPIFLLQIPARLAQLVAVPKPTLRLEVSRCAVTWPSAADFGVAMALLSSIVLCHSRCASNYSGMRL